MVATFTINHQQCKKKKKVGTKKKPTMVVTFTINHQQCKKKKKWAHNENQKMAKGKKGYAK